MILTGDELAGPTWLDSVLQRGGWSDAGVEAIETEPMGDGVGLLGSVVRIRITYDRQVTATGLRNPSSVVLKRASADPRTRAIANHFGYYGREAGVYRDLLPRPGVAAPACYTVETDEADDPVLLLEDLGRCRTADQVVGATPADAFAAAEMLGSMHASYWDHPKLRSLRWLPGPSDPVIADYGSLFDATWPSFLESHGAAIDPALLEIAPGVASRFDDACRRFTNGVITLVHGDFRLDNLCFVEGPPPVAIALDWQLAAYGRGPYDLAFFAAGSLDTATRRSIEDELIERYHATLVAGGVPGYRLADCREDYRWGHVLNLPNPITAAVAVDPGNARGAELLAINAARALAAVADHWG